MILSYFFILNLCILIFVYTIYSVMHLLDSLDDKEKKM
jgi:hypothetical protein